MKNFEQIKASTKQALCDMKRGAVVIKDKAVELYKKRPDVILGGAAGLGLGTYLVGLYKGLTTGYESGVEDAGVAIGTMIAAHNKQSDSLSSDELKAFGNEFGLK